MVEKRSGDELDLVGSSIRAVYGTSVSTSLFVVSGLIYAFVTTPSTAGEFFFISLLISLIMRPIAGIAKTLHKIGSESGENVSSYLGIALGFSGIYLLGITGCLFILSDFLAEQTIYRNELFIIAVVLAITGIVGNMTTGLLSAVGYPGYITWIQAVIDFCRLSTLLVFADAVSTVTNIIIVNVSFSLLIYLPVFYYIGILPSIPNRDEIARSWDFAKWSIPDQVVDRLSYSMPVYVLGIVATPTAVGIYEAADRLSDFGATISWRLSSPLMTKVSGEWSVNKDSMHEYLDSAVTGGTGVTFAVIGYLISSYSTLSSIVFPEAPFIFSVTMMLVGGINILRGFWTLISHAMEGVNQPSVSLTTKLYGLIISVPVTVLLAGEYGAIAGAIGYIVMNIVISVYVFKYSRDYFGRLLVDWNLVLRYIISTIISGAVSYAIIQSIQIVTGSMVLSAVIGAFCCIITYGAVMYLISDQAKKVIRRALKLTKSTQTPDNQSENE